MSNDENSQTSGSSVALSTPTNPVINIGTSEATVSVRSVTAKKQTRDSEGRFIKEGEVKIPAISITTSQNQNVKTGDVPDLVNFKVTNPLVYIKAWWKRIMANEGLEFKFKAKPITAIAISIAIFSLVFGLGGFVFPVVFPFLNIKSDTTTTTSPTPTSDWRETALKGTLKKTTSVPIKFFLLASSDEAVTLQAPDYITLDKLIGKRILATGNYSQKQKILIIQDVQDLEVLSTTPIPIPTSTPSPKPTETPIPTVQPTVEPTIEPSTIPTGECLP